VPPKLFGFDLETYLFRPGLPHPRLVCGSWSTGEEDFIGLADDAVRFFVETLERGDHLVGVNIAFDVVVMAAHRPDLLPLIFEAGNAGLFHSVDITEALNDIAKGELAEKAEEIQRYSLALLMERHFKVDISAEKTGDVWRYKYAQLDGVPLDRWPQEAIDYPKRDARRPVEIRRSQRNQKFRNMHDEAPQVRAAIAIELMRSWGFRTDRAYVAKLDADVEAEWQAARAEFGKAGIYRPNGTMDKKFLAQLVSKAYAGNPPKAPKGGVSTDRDTLVDSGSELLERLGNAGKNDKRRSTYLPKLKEGLDVPVTPEFNILVATGRVSSDWQQMPQKGGIREAVVSRGFLHWLETGEVLPAWLDTVLGSLDYGGLELRTMSQRAINVVGFSKMAEYLNTGKDAHCHFGAVLIGTTYEDFLARKKELKRIRDVAKIGNFGFGGGAGGGAIAYNAKVKDNVRLCLSLQRAERCGVDRVPVRIGKKVKRVCRVCVEVGNELREKWLQAWPEQKMLFDMANRLTKGGRTAEVEVFGSRRVRGKCRYTQWLNTPFQGAGGDGMKRAMWKISEEAYTNRRSPLWGTRFVLQVHDEGVFEFPADRAHDAAFRASEIMVAEMDAITPDAKNEAPPAIMRRMFKSATDVYDREKRLKPYWPEGWNWAPDQARMCADLAA
jgi:DNA polymerase-1